MEQKPQQQTTVVIKEEIADTNCSVKENIITQRAAKSTSKGGKETNETDGSMKIERISSPTGGGNVRGASSPKHTTVPQVASSNSTTASTILKTALTHFPSNSRSADELSPPSATMGPNNVISDIEQNSMPAKSSLKVKRLLSTLLQFANTINADARETVKALIFNLACNAVTIEEFHSDLQDATNFPLRPFVLPFLKNYIPALQKEISIQAKISKQNVQQYVRQHENCVLDPFCPSSELSEVFNQMETVSSSQSEIFSTTLGAKRRYDCLENNVVCHKADSPTESQVQTPPPMKKVATSNSYSAITNGSPYAGNTVPTSCYANDYFQIPPPPFLSSGNNWLPSASMTSSKDCSSVSDDRKNAGDSEWNNIYVMLNCILSMVEKTKRALAILQERNSPDSCNDLNEGHLNGVSGEHGSASRRTNAEDVKRTVNELMVHTVRLTEEKMAFVKRKAEEAVNEVKRQAIMELQKAISATDYKVTDHHPTTKIMSENKKSLSSNVETEFSTHNGFHTNEKMEPSTFTASHTSNCWNCGRKAQETCSGCNLARYCGSFCQHKDWESHHQICSSYSNSSFLNIEKPSLSRLTHSEPLLRNNGASDLLNKSNNNVDLTNILKPQSTSAELYKLLPFSINVTTASSEKSITRTINSRPLTPVATTSTIGSLINSKIKK